MTIIQSKQNKKPATFSFAPKKACSGSSSSSNIPLLKQEVSSKVMVECPLCFLRMMASSMDIHFVACERRQEQKEQQQQRQQQKVPTEADEEGMFVSPPSHEIFEYNDERLPGLFMIPNFLDDEEEQEIINHLNNDTLSPWVHSSFNGHCLSKTFGLVTQFGGYATAKDNSNTGSRTSNSREERIVRVNEPSKGEHDIPAYLYPLISKARDIIHYVSKQMKTLPKILLDFQPNECNANKYLRAEGHYLTPHYDDRHLSGPILMNLSLAGTSRMVYSKGDSELPQDQVSVELPRRCLQLVTGDARYQYKHRILKEDLLDEVRISITFRQAGSSSGLIRGGEVKGNATIDSFLKVATSTNVRMVDDESGNNGSSSGNSGNASSGNSGSGSSSSSHSDSSSNTTWIVS